MPPGGNVITTSSVQAYQPSPILLDHASAKSALTTVAGGQPTEALGELGQQTPLGRPAQPAELAPPFVSLASQESSSVTGATLSATGGRPTP